MALPSPRFAPVVCGKEMNSWNSASVPTYLLKSYDRSHSERKTGRYAWSELGSSRQLLRVDGVLKRTPCSIGSFERGKDLDEIAARLKRTIASVQRRVSDLRAHSAFRDLRTEPSKPGR